LANNRNPENQDSTWAGLFFAKKPGLLSSGAGFLSPLSPAISVIPGTAISAPGSLELY